MELKPGSKRNEDRTARAVPLPDMPPSIEAARRKPSGPAALQPRPGYKLTDVGVIPDDWMVKPLSEVFDFESGKAHEQFVVENGPFVVVNSKFISSDGQVRKYANANFCRGRVNDILMVMSDLPNGKALAKCFLVDRNDLYAINQRVCRLKARKDDPQYLLYVLNRNLYFLSFDDGVQQTHLLNPTILKCPVLLPPTTAEQRAIAGALSDVDALIGALDQLLAKKRDLKQAAMQQLLTGHQRLPGFAPANPRFQQTDLGHYPSDWNLKPLAQLVDETRSIRYGIVQPGKYDPRGRLMIRGQDYSKGWVEPKEMFRVSDPIEERYRNARVQTGDLIITIVGAGTGTVETIPDWLDGANLTQTTARIAINNYEADSEFCKHILQTKVGTGQVANFIKGGAQPGLNCGDIKKFDIPMPPNVAEQTAIAEVLSDMDAELAALEQKRDKTRLLKQGMMQELLTGRTRLV